MRLLPRRHYLAIAGMDTQLFKTLQRRDQIPLLGAASKPVSLDPEVAATRYYEEMDKGGYTAIEALMLAVANHLAERNSFTRGAAARTTQGHWNVLIDAVRRAEQGEEIWYAALSWDFGHDMQPDDEGSKVHWSWVYAGSFDEVVAALNKEREITRGEGGRVDSIAMMSLTPIVARAHHRAEELGLRIESFFPDLPGSSEAASAEAAPE